MPSPETILSGAASIANGWRTLGIGWHALLGQWPMYARPQSDQGVPVLKRFEFMSPTWIAMAREQILRAVDGKDLSTIRAIDRHTMPTARSSVTMPMPSPSPATRRLLPPTRL
jgi:hypothetical protein